MSPSPIPTRSAGRFAAAAFALCSLLTAPLAYGQATLIPLGAVKEIYDCSTDGTVAIGSVSFRPNQAPIPRDSLDPADVTWDLPITDLRYITINETTDKARFIAFPADELADHLVTSIILPRDSSARLVFINTSSLDDFGFPQRDAYVWYPDYTAAGDPTKADVVLVGSNLDLKCCSADGTIAYLDDLDYVDRFHRAHRGIVGPDQYSLGRVQIGHVNRASPDISQPEESVDCCSADGLIVYGREYDYYAYRNDPNEIPAYRGEYTWVYLNTGDPEDGVASVTAITEDQTFDRVLVCTDDGQLAVAATQGRRSYHTWTPTLASQAGATPGFEGIYPLEIRNNQRAFGHTRDSSGRDSPMVLNAPSETYTYLVLRPGHNQGEEVEADETVSKVLGYSIRLNAQTGVEEERLLVRWIPALSSVELLKDVYGTPTGQDVVTLYTASRDITKLYCTIDDGSPTPRMYRVEQQPDPPPSIATVQITTNLNGSGERLTVTFDEDVASNGVLPTLNLSGGPVAVSLLSESPRVFVYKLDRRVSYDETGTLDLAAGAVTDFGLNDNLAVVGQDVVNNSDFNRPPPDDTGPLVTGAAIGADGETLTLIFDENVRHVKVPLLTGFEKPVVVRAAGRKVVANSITYQLSRTIYEGESGNYRLTAGSVQDGGGNGNLPSTGPVLNDSTIPDPTDPPPEPPKDRPITKKRPLGKTANSYAQAAYDTSAYFYLEPYYTENAYYAYLSSYSALSYAYQAGAVVRYGGPKLPKKNVAMRRYKDARYQQVLESYNALQFAYSDYAVTGSTTMVNTYTYAYYAYYYGLADLEAK